MALILGIETSCDETAAAVYDTTEKRLLSNSIFSQIKLHEMYGGVVPEIASRSHLEKIDLIVRQALTDASCSLDDISTIGVTNRPGLVGSLLIGLCFAKGIAWAKQKNIIGIDHLEGHIFSSFLMQDNTIQTEITFPHINLSVSGGHTCFYLVHDFGRYELLGQTTDDAAGEAFDKVAKLLGFGYPGGPIIEQYANKVHFQDFFSYPRTKNVHKDFSFSFSGLKTAVLYHLVREGFYDLKKGLVAPIPTEIQEQVASSILVCIGDIFQAKLELAFKLHPDIQGFTFTGGVACNRYLRARLSQVCQMHGKWLVSPPPKFCVDNGAMIAFVTAYRHEQGLFSGIDLDVFKKT